MANLIWSLGPWQWDVRLGAWAPPAGSAGGIDLAGEGAGGKPGGPRACGLFASGAALGKEYARLGKGDPREIQLGAKDLDAWKAICGYRPSAASLADAIWDHVTAGADPDGQETPPPLMPDATSTLAIVLPEVGEIRREVFAVNSHRHANRVIARVRRDLRELKRLAKEGKTAGKSGRDPEFHRRVLLRTLEDLRLPADQWRAIAPPDWDDGDSPLPHATSYTESFTGTGSALGADLTWTELANNWDRASDVASLVTRNGWAAARADADVSSVNHHASATVVVSATSDSWCGPAVRCSSSADTCYFGLVGRTAGGYSYIEKRVSGTNTILIYSSSSVAASMPLRLQINGSSLTLTSGATQLQSITDTAISGGTRGGICGYAVTNGSATLDNWAIEDLPGAITLVCLESVGRGMFRGTWGRMGY